jgi:hypothetical protein
VKAEQTSLVEGNMKRHIFSFVTLVLAFAVSNALAGTVKVLDSHSGAIQGVRVQWSTNNFNTYSSGTTDASGVVTTAPTSGTYSFRASYHNTSSTQTNKDIGVSDVTFYTSEMQAQVNNHLSTAIAGVLVQFSPTSGFGNYVSIAADGGGLAKTELFPGTCYIRANYHNTSAVQSTSLAGDGTYGGASSSVTFYTSEMQAQVYKHDGTTPFQGVLVRFSPSSGFGVYVSVNTDAGGLAKTELFPGTIYLRASVSGTSADQQQAPLAGNSMSIGATSLVTFYTSESKAEVKNCSGDPIGGVRIQFFYDGTHGTYVSANTNASGIAVTELFSGTHDMQASINSTAELKTYTLTGNGMTAGQSTTTTFTPTKIDFLNSGTKQYWIGNYPSGYWSGNITGTIYMFPGTVKFKFGTYVTDVSISGCSLLGGILTLLDHNGNGLSGGTASWADGSWHSIPGATDANGHLWFAADPSYGKIAMTYHQGSITQTKVQLAASNYTWQTVLARIRLLKDDCTTLIPDNPGGDVAQGGGYWETMGNTGPNGGYVDWEVFGGIAYKFRMTYHGASQEMYPAIPVGGGNVDFCTALVKLWFTGTIEINFGSWGNYYTNPMYLLPVNHPLYFSNTTHPRARWDLNPAAGTVVEKTIAYIRLRNSNGSPQSSYTAKWYRYDVGLPYLLVSGTPDGNGVLINPMEGYNNTYYAYHKVQYLNAESYSPLAQIPASNSFYDFQLTKVTVQLKNHDGTLVTGTGPDVYFHTYFAPTPDILFGTLNNGTFSRDLLMGYRHYFTINNFNGTAQQIWQDDLTTPVVFLAFLANDGGWGCTNYSQYPAADYSQTFPGSGQIELLPGHRIYYKNNLAATEYFDVLTGGVTLNLNTGAVARKAEQGEGRVVASEVPTTFALSQNYPNPFNPTTSIRVALPVDATVSLAVYNTLGQKVAELMNGPVGAGYHDVRFDATKLASGLYIYRMVAKGSDGKDFTSVQKMLLVK